MLHRRGKRGIELEKSSKRVQKRNFLGSIKFSTFSSSCQPFLVGFEKNLKFFFSDRGGWVTT